MDSVSPIDSTALDRLLRLGGEDFVKRMIELFLSYAEQKIAEARLAHKAGNLAGVAKAVHPLKSSSGNVGARAVQELASRLEQLALKSDGAPVAELLSEMEQAFQVAKLELMQRQAQLPGTKP